MGIPFFSVMLTGAFAVAAAIGAVLLKSYLDRTRLTEAADDDHAMNPFASPAVLDSAEPTTQPRPQGEAAGRGLGNLVLLASVVVGGTLLGILTRAVRPYFQVGGTHLEMLAAMGILGAACIALIIQNRRRLGVLGYMLFCLEVAALWAGFACGWSLVEGRFWDDLVSVSIVGCLFSCMLGSIVLAVIRWRDRWMREWETPLR